MNHVAFIQSEPLSRILSGVKRAECRLSINRPPAWKAEAGDTILFKESGGEITCRARIKAVSKFESLTPGDVSALAELVAPLTGASPTNAFWLRKKSARYAVIMELDQVERVSFPPEATPRGVMSAWVTDFQAAHLATVVQSA